MINPKKKRNRVAIGKQILSAYPNSRLKIQKLIGYPQLQKLSIGSNVSNADIVFSAIGDKSSAAISAIFGESIEIDAKEIEGNKPSKISVTATQLGSAWSISEVNVSAKFSDGSAVTENIFGSLSGDGTGVTVPVSVTKEIPSPAGWPKF